MTTDEFINKMIDIGCRVEFARGFDIAKRITVSWINGDLLNRETAEISLALLNECEFDLYSEFLTQLSHKVKSRL